MWSREWNDHGSALGELFAESRVLGEHDRDDRRCGVDLALESLSLLSVLLELAAKKADLLCLLPFAKARRAGVDPVVPLGEDVGLRDSLKLC
ncbi:hypothetical protein SLV14_001548 [Streptomyces sp. Je 1-4]|uniref:hypothetical protein n=1 Tax=Streptomyces TaxID=1883 RepID=UPI0021DB23BD|nr:MULTISPECIES: hypothetical protein [unclassified Streptomyces]UYB39099.1 hypothetical protein SLV14_001548 [Streptomyces sp. Je 1-4]UZQ35104.1 hypothetical protein SLV14N_001548 [Streptomyces sp. Je 1-4] [Streptomyces sp. Je 1-4 4N24]UZQ42522.1 hypothetical protein SLV14NA_001548 [Streptomyces sp. Je 1-4] [Streptomyces sp. Je 1-4 4N24_ara]